MISKFFFSVYVADHANLSKNPILDWLLLTSLLPMFNVFYIYGKYLNICRFAGYSLSKMWCYWLCRSFDFLLNMQKEC